MMLPWWAWAVAAAALGFLELHAPGSYLVWIGLGAAATSALDAAFGLSLTSQVAVFAASSAVCCGVGFFVYRALGWHATEERPLNRRDLSLVGEHGLVCARFVDGRGKVRLGDTVWLAEGPDLAENAHVVVTAVRGPRLVVAASGTA